MNIFKKLKIAIFNASVSKEPIPEKQEVDPYDLDLNKITVDIYKKAVEELIDNSFIQQFGNNLTENIVSLHEVFFLKAKADVKIFSINLPKNVFDEPRLIEALKSSVERKIFIDVIVQDIPESEAFLNLCKSSAYISIRKATCPKILAEFSVMDSRSFRYSAENIPGFACMTNPDIGNMLGKKFDELKTGSIPLVDPEDSIIMGGIPDPKNKGKIFKIDLVPHITGKRKYNAETGLFEDDISEDKIKEAITRLGKEISATYLNTSESPLIVVGLLKGSFIFMADLIRKLNLNIQVDFMMVSSYNDENKQEKELKIILDLNTPIAGRDVLLVDDILDTGKTFSKVIELLKSRNPKSVKTCVLLNKKEARVVEVPLDFYGFDIPNKFAYGYGLDNSQLKRNLPFVLIQDQ